MQGGSVDDEDAEAGTGENAEEVPLVPDDVSAEGERESGLDREDLLTELVLAIACTTWEGTHVEALDDEDRQIH